VAAALGEPPGRRTFERESAIRESDWFGKYWARWGDALVEAGLSANPIQARIPDEVVFRKYAELTRALGHLPSKGELRLAKRRDSTFPSENTFAKYGTKADLVERLRSFCESSGDFGNVAEILDTHSTKSSQDQAKRDADNPIQGYVYLMKFGKHFKIGMSNAVGRRERELAIQLPERMKTVHVIKTDDPTGIEAYWHNRFASKRANGEWFELDALDIKAFKRRKYQ